MKDIVYVTSNQAKFEEAKELLPFLERRSEDITEIQGSPRAIIEDKVATAYEAVREPCIVDDASLMIDDLGGSPGPYVKDFLDGLRTERIGELFEGSRAKAVLFLGYKDEETMKVFRSCVQGRIVLASGDGWGYEPVFQPADYERTWAELDIGAIKHRAKAMRKLKAYLDV